MKERVHFQDLGRIDYKVAWDHQTQLQKSLIDLKLKNRDLPVDQRSKPRHFLLFCEHHPVYTLGKSGHESHLLLEKNKLEEGDFSYYKINRGGDITYHGPGQIVVYPIFDLDHFFTDIHKYVRMLEQIVIDTVSDFDIKAERLEGMTGVWLPKDPAGNHRKICAIGVHLSRWVTMHGLALNVNTNLNHFKNIIPCGIGDDDKVVSSMSNELGLEVDQAIVKGKLKTNFARHFDFEFV